MNSGDVPVSMHLVCRIQHHRLRGWREYAVDSDSQVADILRPEAYSSSSPVFRSYVRQATEAGRSIVLWIVTRHRGPKGQRAAFSLVAKMRVRALHESKPGQDLLPDHLRRYDRPWKKGTSHRKHQRVIAESDPGNSRFYPACDIRECLGDLAYVNLKGKRASGHPQTVMQVDPDSIRQLEDAARHVASHTVFLSYKHVDFEAGAPAPRPPWQPKALAHRLIRGGLGVWFDGLCAPQPARRDGTVPEADFLTDEEVRLLLAEGHRQSSVLLGINTGRYLTPGTDGVNWTRKEYDGSISNQVRSEPQQRFVLHGPNPRELPPEPHCARSWEIDVDTDLVSELGSMLGDRAQTRI
jgi:hypothetical protein